MQPIKKGWKRLPDKPRRILTLIFGLLLVVTAPLIGWLPGPGGMILFLLGIAVLATEFEWAERLRDQLLHLLRLAGAYIHKHPRLSALFFATCLIIIVLSAYVFYTYIL